MRSTRLTIILVIFCCSKSFAQFDLQSDDSLLSMLKNKYTAISRERIKISTELISRHLPSQPIFDSLKNIIVNEAEVTRNREMMCDVYNKLAEVYLDIYQKREYLLKAKSYIDNCISIANESGLDMFKVASLIKYAWYYKNGSENQKALEYNNQAIALATSIGNDSMLCEAYTSIANTWDALANKLARFQSLLNAREFAERSKSHELITRNYINIAAFYKETGQYEKCKDYYTIAIENGRKWKQWYTVLNGMRGIGQACVSQQKNEAGLAWYNRAMVLCDSLNLQTYRVNVNLDLLNYYFNYETPEKGLAYLHTHPELMKFINDVGVGYQLNKLYAASKSHEKQYDSAVYYMTIAAPYEYDKNESYSEKYNFTIQWALLLRNKGDYTGAKEKLLLAKNFADSAADLNYLKDISQRLDSAYLASGDYKNAYFHYTRYNLYKDSLDILGRQRDLLNVEIANTNKRAEQQKLEEESLLRQRDNLQYMGITAAIATIFIVLVLFGVFKISPAIIKALGFFAFIFLFEFITLLLDKQIHEITHGEPWKVMAIKIILIAMLLPMHHWLEEKVLHYLTDKAHKLKPGFKMFKRSSSHKVSPHQT